MWSKQATREEPPFKLGAWIIPSGGGLGECYNGEDRNPTETGSDWGVWVWDEWRLYEMAPLCYPKWWTTPSEGGTPRYTTTGLGGSRATYAEAYRQMVLSFERQPGALGAGWRGFPEGLSDREGYALLME